MTSPLYCRLSYQFRCCVCGNTKDIDFALHAGMELPLPCAPRGWKILNGAVVCEAHKLEIKAITEGVTATEDMSMLVR